MKLYFILSMLLVILSEISIWIYVSLFLTGFLTYSTWNWILKKYEKNDKLRKFATWIMTFITTPVIYFVLFMIWLFISYQPSYEFSKDRWFADKEKRYKLSDDIINKKMLIGKTKFEVRQLLGDENNTDESDNWRYYLGLRPGPFNIDPEVLEIEFKEGKVIKVIQHET